MQGLDDQAEQARDNDDENDLNDDQRQPKMNGVVALEHAIGRVHHRLYACRHVRHLSLSLSFSTPSSRLTTTKLQQQNKQPQQSDLS
jgi:hypothetical protein